MDLRLKIVDLLSKNMEKIFTINEIAKSLGEYYSFVHRTVGKLTKEGIVIQTKAGKSHLCSLNLENEKTMALIQLSEIESRDEFYRKNKELKLIFDDFVKGADNEKTIAIILFGSYAKGTANKESDIDILIVAARKFNIDKIAKEIHAKYGKEISTVLITPEEFRKQKDKAIIKEIIKDHFVLYGAESFVKMAVGK